MNYLERIGKRRTILISISILLDSLYTIYFYNSVVPEIETKKIIQQIIRFLLTVGLLVMIYRGKNWAKNIFIILFLIGIFGAIYAFFSVSVSIISKIPLIIKIVVYSAAIYHFGFSKSFKAFSDYQNRINK
ncbi:MAG: hypothetical protein ACOVQC_02165 [Flavobacterium sp.]